MTALNPLLLIVFFICALLFSLVLNRILLRFASTLGIRGGGSEPVIRWDRSRKPSLGGITFYIIFLISNVAFFVIHGAKEPAGDEQFLGFFAASTLGFLMGLADDAYDTIPLLKFFTQICCALLLLSTGTCIVLFPYTWLNYLITILWVVGIMNSVNMLDNMDGIASVVALGIATTALFIAFEYGESHYGRIFMLAGLIASLTGFLFYNWSPSRIYMGDTGSQFLGIVLAFTGIVYMWNYIHYVEGSDPAPPSPLFFAKRTLVGALIYILPLADTASVVLNRLIRKRSPFVGGKDHTTHCLCYAGLSERQVALLFSGIALLSSLIALYVQFGVSPFGYHHLLWGALYCLLIFGVLFSVIRIFGPKAKK